MKAVSLIVQFVIFFIIGLGFFLVVGNVFSFQSDVIKQDILDTGLDTSINQLSAASVRVVDSCKACDNVTIKIDQKSIAGYYPVYQLLNGIILKITPENKTLQNSVHNLNYSVNFTGPDAGASKTIDLTYDRTKNNLVIE
ncbi:MAG: hypothetical protein HYW23_00785 [Candidatus Aenigmarchaeota archaeon]|nr:hypothetical protein [Candidatus Aenigmarchaeota archaeon]